MSLRRPIVLASVAAAGIFASAAYAYVCHPSAAGTRMLALRGSVISVKAHGASFGLVLEHSNGSCAHVIWNATAGSSRALAAGCSSPVRLQASSVPSTLAAGPAGQRVVVVRGTNLEPDVLKVYGAGGVLQRTLPLPARPQSLQSSGGIAVFSARGQGIFAVRLSDGLFGYLGPDGGAFAPVLDQKGVIFHDGESKAALRNGTTMVEYVPRPAIMRIIARTARPLVTGGPIRSISMDGPRVAVAVGDNLNRCDRVLYWNIAWWPAQRVSSPSGVTCMVRPDGVKITSVAIGGFRAEWLVTQAGRARLIAGSPLCQEWVLGRYAHPAAVRALAGDGATLAFATSMNGRTTVSAVNGRYRPVAITGGAGTPRIAVDGARVAVLWPDGTATVRSARSGALLESLDVGKAGAIALQGNVLTVLAGNRLEVFDLATGRQAHSWPVPARARTLDLQDGVASFASGRAAVVLDIATGRTAVIGRGASRLTGVQIEGPGLAFAWTSGSKGVARFLTTRQVDVALGIIAA
jgi:hypothetical protein